MGHTSRATPGAGPAGRGDPKATLPERCTAVAVAELGDLMAPNLTDREVVRAQHRLEAKLFRMLREAGVPGGIVLGEPPRPPAYELARWIIRLRLRLGLSQAQLADRIHTRPSVVAAWESGARHPQPCWMEKLILLEEQL